MTKLKQTKILPYSASLLSGIVLDVSAYPQFLPWCKNVKIISHEQEVIIADMTIEFKMISEQYRSRITYNEYSRENRKSYIVKIEAIQGPFKHLTSCWELEANGETSTIVKFAIDFQLKSLLLDKIIGAFFYKALERIIEAFQGRAKHLDHKLD